MTGDTQTRFPPEIELALAHTPAGLRPALDCALALDQRLGRIVAATSEPMLGQMRLAWWRDMLGKPVAERPTGDAVLDALGQYWADSEDALIRLVDGWEVLVASEALGAGELTRYASGRAAPFGNLFGQGDEVLSQRVHAAAETYAYADLTTGLSNEDERKLAISQGLDGAASGTRLPSNAKGLAVLEALASRALKRGGRPLMDGRGAALVAVRAAIFAR